MKSTKNFIAIFSLLLFAIISCQKEALTSSDSNEVDAVEDFLKMSSSATGVVCSKDSTDSLHHRHHFNITEMDVNTLPSTVTDYISLTYPNAVIIKAGKDSLGYFYIKITKFDSTHVGLLFDPSGNFVKEIIHQGRFDKGTKIEASQLPSAVTTYISTNYSGLSIHKAILESDGSYKVILIQTDGSYLGLSFSSSGEFVSTITVMDKHGKRKGRRK